MLLLAQLIAPPLQPGPVRLPEPAPLERSPVQPTPTKPRLINDLDQDQPAPEKRTSTSPIPSQRPGQPPPRVQGSTVYSAEQLHSILATCQGRTAEDTVKACAAALTARYVTDGYINTRVYGIAQPAPGVLDVVEGRIAELRIDTADPRFARRIRRLLLPLQGSVLNLPKLDRQILQLKRWPGIGTVQGSIGRLGSDPTLAVLTLKLDQRAEPLQGEVSLRDDGNAGNGQWRAVAVALQNDLIKPGDTLLIYGEGDINNNAELGAVITSLSYSYPITETVRLTGSFGYSRRNLVEGPLAAKQWSFRQFQGYGQLEWVFHESLRQRWFAFGGLSLNRNDSDAAGVPVPLLNGFRDVTNATGFFRFGVGVNGVDERSSWAINVFGLQGANTFSQGGQLANMASNGVIPGQASALGGSASLAYALSPNASLNIRGAGQYAFNPLTPDMGFSLGSDTGIRGLPGQTISGDSGYLGTAEIAWTCWRSGTRSVQLVPFIGYGGITTNRYVQQRRFVFNNGIGAGGIMARVLAGQHWQLELGWVKQIDEADQLDNAIWGSDHLLGNGLYTTVKYRF